jgi:hypothetical protein
MPLDAALEELLGTITDESDRTVLRTQLEKHEPLRKGYLRQAEFSRKMNDVDEELKQGRVYKIEYERVKDIANKNVDFYETEKAKADRLEAELTAATAKAASVAGIDVNDLETKVAAKILANPHLSQAGIAALIATEATKLQQAFFNETLPNTMTWVSDMARVERRFEKEWGEEIDRKAFSKFMVDEKIAEPEKALESFTAARRQEKAIEQAKKDAVAAHLKSTANEGMPGTGAPPYSGPVGPVQAKIQAANGSSRGAAEAAEALFAAGKT